MPACLPARARRGPQPSRITLPSPGPAATSSGIVRVIFRCAARRSAASRRSPRRRAESSSPRAFGAETSAEGRSSSSRSHQAGSRPPLQAEACGSRPGSNAAGHCRRRARRLSRLHRRGRVILVREFDRTPGARDIRARPLALA